MRQDPRRAICRRANLAAKGTEKSPVPEERDGSNQRPIGGPQTHCRSSGRMLIHSPDTKRLWFTRRYRLEARQPLNVQICDLQRVFLNEVPARLNFFAH